MGRIGVPGHVSREPGQVRPQFGVGGAATSRWAVLPALPWTTPKTYRWWTLASIGCSVSPATPNFSPSEALSAQEELLIPPRGYQVHAQDRVFIMDSGKSRVQFTAGSGSWLRGYYVWVAPSMLTERPLPPLPDLYSNILICPLRVFLDTSSRSCLPSGCLLPKIK